ncbi:ribosomal-protein-alanine N-acetyltransferase [Lachnospiraceae bacterium]|nr:ribosomal-protein-alanine N-acetyltransferase [Lachnospiraceae bacterium]
MITIRQMTEADAGSASALEADNFPDGWTEQAFEETLRLDYAYYYVAEADGQLIGICGLRNIAGEGEITNVSVQTRYRQKGVASALLEHTLKEGEKLGIRDFTLEVRCSNYPAIGLYEKFGFQGEGVRKGFYEKLKESGEREDALIMWKRQAMDGTITTVFPAN